EIAPSEQRFCSRPLRSLARKFADVFVGQASWLGRCNVSSARAGVAGLEMVTSGRQRIAYVDWLRALALAGVFAIHVCEVFNPWDEWHISNAERSRVLGEIAVLMAPWIMPLFILLAGLSAWYSLSHRSNATYVAQRVSRVLVPLVVGTLLLVPPQVYLERRLRGQFLGSFLAFLPHFFDGI